MRRKIPSESELDNIPGIGEKRKANLIRYFGSIENIKKADIKDMLKVAGMNKKSTQSIVDYFEK